MTDFNLDEFNITQGSGKKNPSSLSSVPDGQSEADEISHAPLDLGGSVSGPVPAAKQNPVSEQPKKPATTAARTAPTPLLAEESVNIGQGRITGVKIFFTKLHAGAIDFLSEQITEWLKENPDITIKRTNAVVGEIAAKKTEPNLIITVWY